MKSLKTLAYLTAGFAYALIVLGAVVRITESGLGCGDHWPLCNGRLIPVFTDYTVVIEYTHRIAALGLFALIVSLTVFAFAQRSVPGVAGRGGVLRPAILALGLYFSLAVAGAIVVKVDLHFPAVVIHLSLAMGLLAALLVAGWRAAAGDARWQSPPDVLAQAGTTRMTRAVIAALVLSAITILLGGLTATTGASGACQGFPLCNGQAWPTGGGLVHTHWTHRLLAYALTGHLFGVAMGARRRRADAAVQSWAWLSVVMVIVQVAVAATMVLTHLPPSWRGLHMAAGTGLWVAVVGLAWRVVGVRPAKAQRPLRTEGSGPAGSGPE